VALFKPVSISLSPNTELDDIFLAFKLQFLPWLWQKGKAIDELERKFQDYIGMDYAVSFNSGRSALTAILGSLDLNIEDEILLQAFTCNAVVNPILWLGLKPKFVDCNEETLNLDTDDLERKISPRSKVLIVQHTFGIPAQMEKIIEVCQKNNLTLIEDCAHSLGATYKEKKVGTFGKAAFFSFSRDKVISSVYGGIATTNDLGLAARIKIFQEKFDYPLNSWIFQQLLHPIIMNLVILPSYKIFGKYLLMLLQNLHILSKAVHWKEKIGKKPEYFPKSMPNALSMLALKQLTKIDRFNKRRKELADFYIGALKDNKNFQIVKNSEGGIFLRFVIKHPRAHEIIKKAWKDNILIGDWYDSVIAPKDTKLDTMQYVDGSCPVAEKLSMETFNLPTHINISDKDADGIVFFLRKWTFER